jgi:hypothetical protein
MEFHLKKNEAVELMFPFVTTASPETFITGETIADTAYYSDTPGSWSSLAITDTVTEIASTGMYELQLTQSEMNHDRIIIKLTSTSGADSAIVIRTYVVDVDDLVRSTTPANTLDVSAGGEAGIDWANVGSPTTTVGLSGTTIKSSTDTESDIAALNDLAIADVWTGGAAVDTTSSTIDLVTLITTTTNSTNAETAIGNLNDLAVADLLSSGQALDTTLGVLDVVNLVNTTTVSTDAEADIAALNDFDPTSDAVANVTLVATTTASTNAETAIGNLNDLAVADILSSGQALDTTLGVLDNVDTVDTQVTADVTAISGDSAAADNLELQYDGTGLIGDPFPSRQDQISSLGSGVSLPSAAISKVLTDGAATNDYDATANHDGTLYIVTDNDNSDPGIDTELRYDVGDAVISHVHLHGWYQDGSAPFTNSCLMQAYAWESAAYETIETLSHATAEQPHEPLLLSRHKSTTSNGPGGSAGIIDIRFIQAAQDGGSGSTINIDHCIVMYINPAASAVEVWAYVLAELAVDGDPGATPTAAQALMLEYMKSRNQHDASTTEESIYNNAGSKILERDLTDDATTASASKVRNPD